MPSRKVKLIFRRSFLGYVTAGLRAIFSALGRWPIRVWVVGTIAIAIGVAGFLMVLPTPIVNAQPESGNGLDCLNCHLKTLDGHDKLGTGNEACGVCHYSTTMGVLHLADNTQLPLSDSSQLCAQCHQERYNAWTEDTHGIPIWGGESEPAISDTTKTTCTDCHDPHQPQIALLGITKPPPLPIDSPPSPPVQTLIIVVTSLVVLMGIGVAVARKGEQQ